MIQIVLHFPDNPDIANRIANKRSPGNLLEFAPDLDPTAFAAGNITPDSGIPMRSGKRPTHVNFITEIVNLAECSVIGWRRVVISTRCRWLRHRRLLLLPRPQRG
jgi:hypothetical protein